MFEFKTRLGEIKFSQNVVNKIVADAVERSGGKAEIVNFKGRYVNNVAEIASMMNLFDEESDGIRLKELEDGFELEVYIIVHFGMSIKRVTNRIIDYIYENFETMLETKPKKVTVIVTGMISKNIAKRHIEVSR